MEFKLKHPVQFGEETIAELHLKPHAGAFKGFTQAVKEDGSMIYDPYTAARVAVRMGGKPDAVCDRLHPEDMNRLAQVALSFLTSGPAIGQTPSP